MSIEGTVHIVDDDPAIRSSLTASLEVRGLEVETYASAQDFLHSYEDNNIGCLVLDIRMPGIDGLDMQKILIEKNYSIPIIFVTGHGNVPMSVQALKNGAVDFLEKPYRQEILLECIEQALTKSKQERQKLAKNEQILERFSLLTPREKEVMEQLTKNTANASNKSIAEKLDISTRTVEDHRAKIMLKMQAKSLIELVSMTETCFSNDS